MSCGALELPDNDECVSRGKKTLLEAPLVNLLLTVFMAFVGFVSGSKAILGSSIYGFKDFVASLVVVIGVRVSEKPADVEHPYGHGKIEFVAMLFIGVAILIASLFLFFHSIRDVWAGVARTDSGSETHCPLCGGISVNCFPVKKTIMGTY